MFRSRGCYLEGGPCHSMTAKGNNSENDDDDGKVPHSVHSSTGTSRFIQKSFKLEIWQQSTFAADIRHALHTRGGTFLVRWCISGISWGLVTHLLGGGTFYGWWHILWLWLLLVWWLVRGVASWGKSKGLVKPEPRSAPTLLRTFSRQSVQIAWENEFHWSLNQPGIQIIHMRIKRDPAVFTLCVSADNTITLRHQLVLYSFTLASQSHSSVQTHSRNTKLLVTVCLLLSPFTCWTDLWGFERSEYFQALTMVEATNPSCQLRRIKKGITVSVLFLVLLLL